jgi:hypothetical protein
MQNRKNSQQSTFNLKTAVGPRLVDANGRKREGFWALSRGTIATVMVSTKEPKGRAMSPICAARRGSTAVFRFKGESPRAYPEICS